MSLQSLHARIEYFISMERTITLIEWHLNHPNPNRPLP